MPSSINPTLPLESESSSSHIFFTSSSEPSGQGGTNLASDEPPPSSRIAFFDWDILDESFLPSDAPIQIKVKVETYIIAHCIVDEGASVSISPSLMSTSSQLLAFDRRTSIALGIFCQTPVTLGGKTVLVDFMVIEYPLDFKILLGHYYVC